MAVLHLTRLLLKNSCFLLVSHSKLEEDFLYMAYADIMAKVSKNILILVFNFHKEKIIFIRQGIKNVFFRNIFVSK